MRRFLYVLTMFPFTVDETATAISDSLCEILIVVFAPEVQNHPHGGNPQVTADVNTFHELVNRVATEAGISPNERPLSSAAILAILHHKFSVITVDRGKLETRMAELNAARLRS